MSVIKKPDLKIFAQDAKTGEVETFPDILRGWGVTLDRTAGKPPLEWFNAIGKRVDEWLMYLTQRGVAEWDTTLSYPKTAIIQFNSIVYVSIKETKGEQPDKSQASWSTLGVFLGLGNYSTTAEMNLALLKKIDKANITHQTGNSTELVASQQLVTTETGKKASKEELNNGLASKFDKTGGVVRGNSNVVTLQNTVDNAALYLRFTRKDEQVRGWIGAGGAGNDISLVNTVSGKVLTLTSTGSLTYDGKAVMMVGDYGFGGYMHGLEYLTESQVADKFKAAVTQIWRNQQETTKYAARYGASLYVRSSDAFWNMNVNHANGDVLISNGLTGQDPSTFKIAKLFSTLNTTTDRNGHVKVANVATELSDCQVGVPLPWPQTTAPAGYLICNGQWFNKTNYPLLAKAYPSGQLPDLRGEFIRGLDAGRNVDSGRNVLSAQEDAIRNITGEFANNGNARESDSYSTGVGAFAKKQTSNVRSNREVDWVGCTYSFDASRVVPTANENRPRNIAFLYIVRAA